MKRLAVVAVVLGALAVPALADAAPTIARPDPATYPVRLDYTSPLPALSPLEQSSITRSVTDIAGLAYKDVGDLGGFIPAPVGRSALWGGGRDVVVLPDYEAQIPLFAEAAGGLVSSFTFAATPPGRTPPPDNGNGNGEKPPVPPTPGNAVPPANQGFGGQGAGGGGGGATTTAPGHGAGGGGGTTTTKRRPPPPTTTTTTTTTTDVTTTIATTTTAFTTTTTTGGGGSSGGGGGCSGGSCSPGSCGTPGISISSTAPSCAITLTNASPGDSAQETMTIQNTSGSPYMLSLKAVAPNNNHLRQDLEMAVYDPGGGAPSLPYPPLSSWLGPFNPLTTLNPGQTVQYVIVLYLPSTVGNADQGETAAIDFIWHAG